jgi:protein-tyrosine phosphatase
MYRFAAASPTESIVFGSARPGYRSEQVQAWLTFMQAQGIQRVCCLLSAQQMQSYQTSISLLECYQQTFGLEQVCWAPIEDFHLVNAELLLDTILPSLTAAQQLQQPVVVHCSGGVGRTGHVLAAWLVAAHQLSNQAAITAVRQMGRNPYEAVFTAPFLGRNPWRVAAALQTLLDQCRLASVI